MKLDRTAVECGWCIKQMKLDWWFLWAVIVRQHWPMNWRTLMNEKAQDDSRQYVLIKIRPLMC